MSAVDAHLREVAASLAFRRFLTAETATAHRVLWALPDAVHSRYVELWQQLLQQAQQRGDLALPYAAEDAAQVLMAVAQVVTYKDLLAGTEPDWELLVTALTALLRGPRARLPRDAGPTRPARR